MTTNTPTPAAIRAALDAMRAREDAATPGPWALDVYAGEVGVKGGNRGPVPMVFPHSLYTLPDDARFIARARQDMPALLTVAEAVASVGPLVVARDEVGQVMSVTVRGDEWEAVTRALAALAAEEDPAP